MAEVSVLALVTATLDPGLAAAGGALLIAVLNELRARARARTADIERREAREAMREVVQGGLAGPESEGGASNWSPDAPPPEPDTEGGRSNAKLHQRDPSQPADGMGG